MGDNYRRLARLGFGIIKEPHGGEIEHDAFTRRIGQYELGREDHPPAFARDPFIHPRIRLSKLLDPKIKLTREVKKCVFVTCSYYLHPADEIRILPQREDLGSNRWRENLARLAELISLPRIADQPDIGRP